jgi:hypothetical protein
LLSGTTRTFFRAAAFGGCHFMQTLSTPR